MNYERWMVDKKKSVTTAWNHDINTRRIMIYWLIGAERD